jgi:serine/threonine protein kinase
MRILWELRHPNILTFFGVAFVRKDGEELMCMVTELCTGSLDIYIGTDKKKQEALDKGMPELTDGLLFTMMRDSAAGLAFMHSRKLIHRDLKVRVIAVAIARYVFGNSSSGYSSLRVW